MSVVTVQYFKYPRIPHWRHPDLQLLGTDEHGTWLGAPTGTAVQRADEAAVILDRPFVQLIAPDRWWTLIVNQGGKYPIYVDITTPPTWSGDDRVELVDLDLDVIRRADGSVEVLDEEEFVEHAASLAYPDRMVAAARATTAEVVLAITQGREPFGDAGRDWLERLDEE